MCFAGRFFFFTQLLICIMISQNPLIGRASGKCAGLVFSTLHGKNIVKAKPSPPSRVPSPGQLISRARFAAASKFIPSVLDYFNMKGWASALGMPVNSFITGYFCKHGVLGSPPTFDYEFSNIAPTPDTWGTKNYAGINLDIPNKVQIYWSTSFAPQLPIMSLIECLVIDVDSHEIFRQDIPVYFFAEVCDFTIPGDNSLRSWQVFWRTKNTSNEVYPWNSLWTMPS